MVLTEEKTRKQPSTANAVDPVKAAELLHFPLIL